jgi:uncharacterized protein
MQTTIRKRSHVKKESSVGLVEAVVSGNPAAVKRLVQAGAKVNRSTGDGFTPLMLAASRGDPRITEYLIKRGADVNRHNAIGQTALMIAALRGQKPIIEQLVLAGADVGAVDNDNMNAVAWAASRGDFPEVISTLVAYGADYNGRDAAGLTPLMKAAMLGYADSAGMLLTVGADETVKFRGKTAYEIAAQNGHHGVCKQMKAILEHRPKGHHL